MEHIGDPPNASPSARRFFASTLFPMRQLRHPPLTPPQRMKGSDRSRAIRPYKLDQRRLLSRRPGGRKARRRSKWSKRARPLLYPGQPDKDKTEQQTIACCSVLHMHIYASPSSASPPNASPTQWVAFGSEKTSCPTKKPRHKRGFVSNRKFLSWCG